MTLDAATVQKLTHPLAPGRVHKREGSGGQQLDYLATHDVIRYANAIFGFGMWGHEVIELVQIGCDPVTSRNGKPGFKVGYRCTIRLTVAGCVPTSGVGYGDGVDYSGSMIPPHELAMKEAESDAMKRALKNFGDQFGLSLYAKPGAERERVEREARVRLQRLAEVSEGSPVTPLPSTTTATLGSGDPATPSLPSDSTSAGESTAVLTPSPAESGGVGTPPAPAEAPPQPAAQHEKGSSERRTLDWLNMLVVNGRKEGVLTTETIYEWALDLDPTRREAAYYRAEDGELHWGDLRSEAPVWLCSQLLDRIKLMHPEWYEAKKAEAAAAKAKAA